jgi:hypothetical protein
MPSSVAYYAVMITVIMRCALSSLWSHLHCIWEVHGAPVRVAAVGDHHTQLAGPTEAHEQDNEQEQADVCTADVTLANDFALIMWALHARRWCVSAYAAYSSCHALQLTGCSTELQHAGCIVWMRHAADESRVRCHQQSILAHASMQLLCIYLV